MTNNKFMFNVVLPILLILVMIFMVIFLLIAKQNSWYPAGLFTIHDAWGREYVEVKDFWQTDTCINFINRHGTQSEICGNYTIDQNW